MTFLGNFESGNYLLSSASQRSGSSASRFIGGIQPANLRGDGV